MWAITSTGEIAQGTGNGEWLSMVCPNGGPGYETDADYRNDKISSTLSLIREFKPYGISLDFIRHFVFWEDVYETTDPASLPNTCFCLRCRDLFFTHTGLDYPESLSTVEEIAAYILENFAAEWAAFKSETITEYTREFSDAIHAENKDIRISIHTVPWKQHEFDSALTRIAGQDFGALGKIADYLSPMCYAKMLRRSPSWISQLTADIRTATPCSILPSIQMRAMYGTGPITDEEFTQYLESANTAPSSGCIFWPWETITEGQKEIIKSKLGR